jgi:excisionase family DNA binding protein
MDSITTKEAAEILRYTVGHVRSLCERGDIPAKRALGNKGQWRIDRLALLAQINAVDEDDQPEVKRPEVKIVEWPSVFEEVKNRVRKKK